MSKFAIGDKVDKAADDHHETGTVVAVFSTTDGHFRYAVDMEGYGALEFFTEESWSFTRTDSQTGTKPQAFPARIGAEAEIAGWASILRIDP